LENRGKLQSQLQKGQPREIYERVNYERRELITRDMREKRINYERRERES